MILVHQLAVWLLDVLKHIQFDWWYDDTIIHTNHQFTQSKESSANWKRWCRLYRNTDSVFHWYNWHEFIVTLLNSYVLLDFFTFHLSNKHTVLTAYHFIETSLCHLRSRFVVFDPYWSWQQSSAFQTLNTTWSVASHNEISTSLHSYTCVLTVSLL